jgi:hypothetical protein
MGPREEAMAGTLSNCVDECKLLSVTGVLTLDEENRLMYFCDTCALHH